MSQRILFAITIPLLLAASPALSGESALRPLPRTVRPPAAKQAPETGVKTAVRDQEEAAGNEGGSRAPGAVSDEGGGGGARSVGQDDGSYRLGPRDAIKIEVWNRAEIEYEWRPAVVTGEGMVFLPMLEDVNVNGLTITEATERLTKLYDQFIIRPQVYLEITEYNSRQVSVIGEVKSPGRYSLRGGALITEVLAEAGDLTENASRIVRLIRPPEDESGTPEVIDINISKINAGDPTQNLRVLPNDVIYALTNKDIVYVSGMVKTEGYVDWVEGMTALKAVILAGGLAEGNAANRTKVFRDEGGATTETKINVNDRKNQFVLKAGDIMYVPASWF